MTEAPPPAQAFEQDLAAALLAAEPSGRFEITLITRITVARRA
jgi:hypothetical protein